MVLKSIDLYHFKAFRRFTVHFGDAAYIVGPNNAGKSTLIQALRGCAHMLRLAFARSPDEHKRDGTRTMLAYSFTQEQLPIVTENLRHESIETESRIVLRFSKGALLTAVWPERASDEDLNGYFYLETADGRQPRRPKEVMQAFPRIGVIPNPAPLEHAEATVQPDTVRRNEDGRLASRHFRNQLYLLHSTTGLRAQYDELLRYIETWTPELRILKVRARRGPQGAELDVFYREAESRIEKELVWCGDGLQIWLQLLFHLFRCREDPIVILDEPDVYLHADLQRRLVRVLENHRAQTLLATHSAEVIGEAQCDSVLWVDRARTHAVRAPEGGLLDQLSGALGSQFNLRLAKALRARVALFVEGDDHKLLRGLAKTVGALNVANELGIAIIPIGGFSQWDRIEPFSWLLEKLLERSVSGFVILDRDYRPRVAIDKVRIQLEAIGLRAHVWDRKEVESYLLVPSTIARVTGAPEEWVSAKLADCAASQEAAVFARALEESVRTEVARSRSRVEIFEEFKPKFDKTWSNVSRRIEMCGAKQLLSDLNRVLAAEGYRTTSANVLARVMLPGEVPNEVRDVLLEIERLTL